MCALRLGPGAKYDRIENNRFENSLEAGLVIGDPEGGDGNALHIITGNTFHTNSQAKSGMYPAVAAYNANSITFCANQVFSWNAGALKHKNSLAIGPHCDRWIVKDNIFRDNSDQPMTYDRRMKIIVTDNLID